MGRNKAKKQKNAQRLLMTRMFCVRGYASCNGDADVFFFFGSDVEQREQK
jgi:hypothetical protein